VSPLASQFLSQLVDYSEGGDFMTDLSQIKDTVECCPNIWYTNRSKFVQHVDGQSVEYSIDCTTFVDYEKKVAKRTVVTTQDGGPFISEMIARDGNIEVTIRKSDNSGVGETVTEKKDEKAYDALFAKEGVLRPIQFAHLIQAESNDNASNMQCASISPTVLGLDNASNIGMNSSNVVFTVCSEDVLMVNSLATFAANDSNNLLMSVDTEILIHLYDPSIDFMG
jgi:hypothetical protein